MALERKMKAEVVILVVSNVASICEREEAMFLLIMSQVFCFITEHAKLACLKAHRPALRPAGCCSVEKVGLNIDLNVNC